jgi:hypothetical protein
LCSFIPFNIFKDSLKKIFKNSPEVSSLIRAAIPYNTINPIIYADHYLPSKHLARFPHYLKSNRQTKKIKINGGHRR